ncbi:hypothetical protein BDR26DRAFT_861842 [Obelidium mucronatum]|nr:hypothetical protein BDR26DRAFT_861842 [Obelidium mucronatum]
MESAAETVRVVIPKPTKIPSSRDRRLRYLFDESVDCMFRHHLSHHQPPPGLGPSEISYHMYDNNVQFPHPRSYKTRAEMQHGLGGTSSGEGGKALNLQGLVPFLTPSDQMNILKAKEKKLLLNRWRETWESVRPPRPGWHEMKGPGFAEEAKRARELLVSPDMQRASQQTRLAILELWRTEVTDRVLFHAPFEGEGGVEDFDGESLRPGGIQELKRMESEALHASIERHGDPGRKALAPWTSSGMRRTTRSFD